MTGVALLEARGLRKRYGPVAALDGVDLTLRTGRIHAVLGENGAGKSTLLGVLAGVTEPDAGSLTLAGAPWRPRGPHDARRAGVAMIHQELSIAPDLSVEQNVVLGAEPRGRGGWIDRRERRARASAALARLGRADIDPRRRAGDLGLGDRQVVEIARALAGRARVLILDEPTSSLPRDDAERLFAVLRSLAREGVAILYVSHFLEEVRRIADEYTVLRDGASVASGELAAAGDGELVAHMAGRPLEAAPARVPRARREAVLTVEGLAGETLPVEATFTLHRGEVLGIAGLVGAGRSELLRALYGLAPVRAGSVRIGSLRGDSAQSDSVLAESVHGEAVHADSIRAGSVRPNSVRAGSGRSLRAGAVRAASPRSRVREGFGFVPEDRKGEGLALGLAIAVNATLSRLAPLARLGWIDRRRQRREAERHFARLRVRCASPWQRASTLSGGNQQKVAIARMLHQDAEIVLLDEPTRGVDVGARAEIHRCMGELAAEGRAVLLVSSYLPELLAVADRIAVMRRGRLGVARPSEEWTEHALLLAASGAREDGMVDAVNDAVMDERPDAATNAAPGAVRDGAPSGMKDVTPDADAAPGGGAAR